MAYSIYRVTSPSNRAYIGYTGQHVKKRWGDHIRNALRYNQQTRFYHAIRKYMPENFVLDVVEEDIETKEKALEREKYWISIQENPYNANDGATGGDLYKMVSKEKKEEWIANLSKATRRENNPRYTGLSDDDIVNIISECSLKHGRIVSIDQAREETGVNIPKSFRTFRFDGKGRKEVYRRVQERTGLPEYNQYYRSEELKRRISNTVRRNAYGKNKEN